MGFDKTGRVGLGDNAQPDTDKPTPPAPSIPPVQNEQEDENADS